MTRRAGGMCSNARSEGEWGGGIRGWCGGVRATIMQVDAGEDVYRCAGTIPGPLLNIKSISWRVSCATLSGSTCTLDEAKVDGSQ